MKLLLKPDLSICISRIYWICVFVISFIGMVVVFQYAFGSYARGTIAISLDRSFLHWKNTFPAISFCMLKGNHPNAAQEIENFVKPYYEEHNIAEPEQ